MKQLWKKAKVLPFSLMGIMYSSKVFAVINPNTFTGSESTNTDGIQKIGNQIISILSTVGSIISVIVLIILGLKYMMGSAEEKASYKKTMVPYIVGAALLFAASNLAQYVFNFAQSI